MHCPSEPASRWNQSGKSGSEATLSPFPTPHWSQYNDPTFACYHGFGRGRPRRVRSGQSPVRVAACRAVRRAMGARVHAGWPHVGHREEGQYVRRCPGRHALESNQWHARRRVRWSGRPGRRCCPSRLREQRAGLHQLRRKRVWRYARRCRCARGVEQSRQPAVPERSRNRLAAVSEDGRPRSLRASHPVRRRRLPVHLLG